MDLLPEVTKFLCGHLLEKIFPMLLAFGSGLEHPKIVETILNFLPSVANEIYFGLRRKDDLLN